MCLVTICGFLLVLRLSHICAQSIRLLKMSSRPTCLSSGVNYYLSLSTSIETLPKISLVIGLFLCSCPTYKFFLEKNEVIPLIFHKALEPGTALCCEFDQQVDVEIVHNCCRLLNFEHSWKILLQWVNQTIKLSGAGKCLCHGSPPQPMFPKMVLLQVSWIPDQSMFCLAYECLPTDLANSILNAQSTLHTHQDCLKPIAADLPVLEDSSFNNLDLDPAGPPNDQPQEAIFDSCRNQWSNLICYSLGAPEFYWAQWNHRLSFSYDCSEDSFLIFSASFFWLRFTLHSSSRKWCLPYIIRNSSFNLRLPVFLSSIIAPLGTKGRFVPSKEICAHCLHFASGYYKKMIDLKFGDGLPASLPQGKIHFPLCWITKSTFRSNLMLENWGCEKLEIVHVDLIGLFEVEVIFGGLFILSFTLSLLKLYKTYPGCFDLPHGPRSQLDIRVGTGAQDHEATSTKTTSDNIQATGISTF
ncbi:uncharacterized protein VP01_129g3 [Puccinia sorghi]|uniref:Uncharacterized protein n=1 Tax=Puccinia sorghi TaxID=27349 RepID=A0A0L6VN78_9BASI|nr:uncharacterized protein VP01_129g3 [Puccinia sorghi]